MHELFTTAVVPNDAVSDILKILQGLCAMTPNHQYERRLIFEGPKAPPLVGIPTSLLPSRRHENEQLWRELHKRLLSQSYYLTVCYILDREQFGLPTDHMEIDKPDSTAYDTNFWPTIIHTFDFNQASPTE